MSVKKQPAPPPQKTLIPPLQLSSPTTTASFPSSSTSTSPLPPDGLLSPQHRLPPPISIGSKSNSRERLSPQHHLPPPGSLPPLLGSSGKDRALVEPLDRLLQRFPSPLRFSLRWAASFLQQNPSFRQGLQRLARHRSIELHEATFARQSLLHQEPCATENTLCLVWQVWALWHSLPLGRGELWSFPQIPSPLPALWLLDLWVHPLVRGARLGTLLTRQLLQRASEQKEQHLGLLVHPDNQPALRLYRSLGFQPFPHKTLPSPLPPQPLLLLLLDLETLRHPQ